MVELWLTSLINMMWLTGAPRAATVADSRACPNTWESTNLAGKVSTKFWIGIFSVSGL